MKITMNVENRINCGLLFVYTQVSRDRFEFVCTRPPGTFKNQFYFKVNEIIFDL